MKLALRAAASSSGSWLDRLFAAVTRWRLCSQWCHAGIVVGDLLIQANAQRGLHGTWDWEPLKWRLIDLGPGRDRLALALFDAHMGAAYDWPGVLGFVLPWVRGKRRKLYCFEWCALALGAPPARWQTPERLLAHIVTQGARP
ncbi:MAG: hypothetical protein LBI48_11505 [Burkholderiaceae bacterium]|jgi:hypothetical protein|nr:hypothetical protein [Burkholderiaceae bacterium]